MKEPLRSNPIPPYPPYSNSTLPCTPKLKPTPVDKNYHVPFLELPPRRLADKVSLAEKFATSMISDNVTSKEIEELLNSGLDPLTPLWELEFEGRLKGTWGIVMGRNLLALTLDNESIFDLFSQNIKTRIQKNTESFSENNDEIRVIKYQLDVAYKCACYLSEKNSNNTDVLYARENINHLIESLPDH